MSDFRSIVFDLMGRPLPVKVPCSMTLARPEGYAAGVDNEGPVSGVNPSGDQGSKRLIGLGYFGSDYREDCYSFFEGVPRSLVEKENIFPSKSECGCQQKLCEHHPDCAVWMAKESDFDWSDLTKAADKYLNKGIRYLDLNNAADRSLLDTLRDSIYPEITDEHVWNFHFFLERAREELYLFDKFLANPELIHHDSSVEEVMKQIPTFFLVDRDSIKSLVQRNIDIEKKWHETDLYYHYLFFLSKSDAIASYVDAFVPPKIFRVDCDAILEKLSEDKVYEKNFSQLSPAQIERGLQNFFGHVLPLGYIFPACRDAALATFDEYTKSFYQILKFSYLRDRRCLPVRFRTAFYYLARKECHEHYVIQDAAVEIVKLQTYFDQLFDGVPSYYHDYS